MMSATKTQQEINLERGERSHRIDQSQLDAINERLEQDSAIIGELGCTIIVLLLLCQIFVLLGVVCYSLFLNCTEQHAVPIPVPISVPFLLANVTDVIV